jgi:acetyl esterase/lipase
MTLLPIALHAVTVAFLTAAPAPPRAADDEPWQAAVDAKIRSSLDGSVQRAMFYVPDGARPEQRGEKVPLLVGLHTWSGDYRQTSGGEYLAECKRRGWVLVHPNFRGPNVRPEACASPLAVQDVLDAVAYAREHARVDPGRIYLVGASGGGHMALVMAARAPHLWAGVSSWVPISDLGAWYRECKSAEPPRKYFRDLEKVFGGPPNSGPRRKAYRERSPLFQLTAAKGVPLDINAGIHDGYTGSVPVHHTLDAFNVLAESNGHPDKQISAIDIASIGTDQAVPEALTETTEPLLGHRAHPVLLHRTAGPARVTLFDGGHEIDVPAALDWLATCKRPQRSTQE